MSDRITTEQAFDLLDVHEGMVHTFVQAGPALIGADWSADTAREAMDHYGARLAGKHATAMQHGVVIVRDDGPVFFATRETGEQA